MSIDNIVLIGTGAQAKYALDIFSYSPGVKICAIVKTGQNIEEKFEKNLKNFNIQIIEDFNLFEKFAAKENIGALVCAADTKKKECLINKLEKMNIRMINAIHPQAVIAKTAEIGKNVIINAGAVIQPYAEIGSGVMIHAQVDVEHDCIVENYVNLAPGVKLAGWVTVKKGAVVYTNACIIPCVKIGSYSIIGAGAVVINDIPANVTAAGNPARIVKRNVQNE